MMTVDLRTAYTGHFPQYQSDQVTPRSGLTDFTVTVWEGNAVSPVVATVSEIGTSGTYGVTFLPTAEGQWSVEVYGATTGDRWADEFVVAQAPLTWQFSAADDGAEARFAVWLERDGVRQLDVESVAAVVRKPDGTTVQDLGTDSADSGDGVFTFTMESTSLAQGQEYYLACMATRNSLVWYNNLGVSKV